MNTRMMNLFFIAAIVCSALIGCKGSGSAGGGEQAQPVVIVERVTGDSAALKELGTMHITTQKKYDALGDKFIFPGEIDFFQYDLVIVALGEQATGGYSIDIESIQFEGNELLVNGKVTTPAADAVTTQAVTYPYCAVLIPNTPADIVVPFID